MVQENYNLTRHQNPYFIQTHFVFVFCFSKYPAMFSTIIFKFMTLGCPILFSSDNKPLRPSKPPRLKLTSKCFSGNPLSPIFLQFV